ncbi:hypothetical protein BV22DRAFT_1014015 [Leucogyrophana mollusca]|uniref:Uncharacterized protein n=1 Tax=Leucogyrophana mollusca TaxID=85980 RepID=A0ACB8BFU8_9AGAM|nr:hypothetical protein BV22DRAFT_1014015 [Leucogyrophana mollusca]
MDSALTLVNVAPPTPYFLSSAQIRDTIIFSHHSHPLYFVTSDTKHMEIRNADSGRIIAVWNHRDFLPDIVAFPHRNGGLPVNVNKWLRKTKLQDGTSALIMDTEWGPYVWKMVSRYRHKVSQESLSSSWVSSSLEPKSSSNYRALILESIAEPIRDDVVVAYLIHRLRLLLEDQAIDLCVGTARW